MSLPFIPFENVARVALTYLLFGQYCQNVTHWHHTTGSIAVEDLTNLGEYLKDWWVNTAALIAPDDVSLEIIHLKDLTTETSIGIDYITDLPVSGSSGNTSAPSNVTAAVKWTSIYSGRSYRGRTFVVGLQQARVTADKLDEDYAATLNDTFHVWLDIFPTDWALGIASSYHNGVRRTVGNFIPAVANSLDPYVDSQRRRLIGRGR